MPSTAPLRSVPQAPPLADVHDLGDFRRRRYQALITQARELMLEGGEEPALTLVFDALRLDPNGYEGLALAGTLLSMLGDPGTAVVYTRQAIRQLPEHPDPYYDLGATLLELDRPTEALEWLERGRTLLAGREDDLVDFVDSARIEALVELGRFGEAEAALAAARERSDDPLQLLATAADLLADRRRRPRLTVVPLANG